jgi:exopolyphosphatase
MTSSILYAYIRSMAPPKNAFTPLYVPITNMAASGISLRPEFLAVFKHANIEAGHLITLDDLPPMSEIEAQLQPENTKWILVDHNVLQGALGKIYASRVQGVIDHHDDEGKVPKDTGEEPRIVEKSGSCTSLVANYCRQSWELLSGSAMSSGAANAQGDSVSDDDAVVKRWDASVAQLGLSSILIDTANLQDASKTTKHDGQAADYLEAKIMACAALSPTFDRTWLYNEIDAAKRDIAGLKLQDILRKDYKQWDQGGHRLGVSSVVKNIGFLQAKAGAEAETPASGDEAFLDAVQVFAKERELDMYSIMTTSTSASGAFQRELLLWAFNERAVVRAKGFEASSRDELGLEEWHGSEGESGSGSGSGSGSVAGGEQTGGEGQWRKVWWQRKVQHSRKRVGPLLREALS